MAKSMGSSKSSCTSSMSTATSSDTSSMNTAMSCGTHNIIIVIVGSSRLGGALQERPRCWAAADVPVFYPSIRLQRGD